MMRLPAGSPWPIPVVPSGLVEVVADVKSVVICDSRLPVIVLSDGPRDVEGLATFCWPVTLLGGVMPD